MRDLINEFSKKLEIKKYLYVINQEFNLYSNVYKEESHINKEILVNKLVEVIDNNIINNEQFYLVSANGNKIGWITLKKPLFLYQTFPEKVIIRDKNTKNDINELLNLYDSVEESEIYTKQYFTEYKENLYFGIVKDDKIISFLQENQFNNGEVSQHSFKFINDEVSVYQDINFLLENKLLNNEVSYNCDIVLQLKHKNIGSFKVGQTNYWFDLNDSDIKLEDIVYTDRKDKEYYILEHLFYSQKIYASNQKHTELNMRIEEDIIKQRFAEYRERINELLIENEKLKKKIN